MLNTNTHCYKLLMNIMSARHTNICHLTGLMEKLPTMIFNRCSPYIIWSMLRRTTSLSIVVLLLIANTPAKALELKIASISPDGAMWMKKLRAGGVEIAESTQRRVILKFYPGGVMGNTQSVLRKMRIGQLHGSTFTAGSLAKIYPDIQIYALPMLFKNQQQVDYVRAKMDAQLVSGLQQKGYTSFGLAGSGFAYTLSYQPIMSLAQLRQRKLWLPTGDIIGSTLLDVAGISPIPLPLSDVLTGLQTGLVDTVAISPTGAIAFQWYTKATFLMQQPLNYTYVFLAIHNKAFNKVSAEDQGIVSEVLSRITNEIDQQSKIDNEQAKQALAQQGVEFVDFPLAMQQQWQEIADQTIEQLDHSGAFASSTLVTLKGHLQQYKAEQP